MIRPYQPSDKTMLMEAFRLNVPQYFAPHEAAEFEGYLDKYGDTYLVIEHEKVIVGGVGYQFTNNNTIGSITWIFIHPAHAGSGLGKLAVEHCLAIFAAQPQLQKWAIRTSQLVYRFFEKYGFKVIRTEKDYWGEGLDLYEMEFKKRPKRAFLKPLIIILALLLASSTLLYFYFQAYPPLQVPSTGTIQRLVNFRSKYVSSRNVDVWLPEGYGTSKKYDVLYMQDGQMLYDPAHTWNKTTWDVESVLAKLLAQNAIRDVIVVGVWNGGKTRHNDYFPQKPFESLSKEQQDSAFSAKRFDGDPVFKKHYICSDNYLKFLVTELKPFIDKTFSTHTDQSHTFISGSSMGGLISVYAICEYPDVFGGAACLSTHWPGIFTVENNPIPDAFVAYLKTHLPSPNNHKIYFDHGTETLDVMYPPIQKKVDEAMVAHGFSEKNWMTLVFPGENHSEKAWNKRLEIPMRFLLNK